MIKAFKQLTEVNLIQEKRQGLGKPNLIYVGKIEHEEIKLDTREKENKNLNKMVDRLKSTLKKFIRWISCKFSYSFEDEIIRDFEREAYTNFDVEKQLDIKQFEKDKDGFEIMF